MHESNLPFIHKEISWLSFNERVLQEAANKDVPIIQRLRYLGIFSNNLDEFYRVRVADVSRLAAFSNNTETKEQYQNLLGEIQENTRRLQHLFNHTYLDALSALNKKKIYLISENQLDKTQSEFVETFFNNHVLPEIDPILLDAEKPFPAILDGRIYLAIKILSSQQTRYGIVEVPTDRIDRFIQIPPRKNNKAKVFIVLENIIRHCLKNIFRGVIDIKDAQGFIFKITLDAELEFESGINQSLINKMQNSLKKRQKADPERFVYDSQMPKDLLDFLTKRLKLTKYDSLMPGSRYHNAKDFIKFPAVGPAYLQLKPLPILPVAELSKTNANIFDSIRKNDILLYYPYHSFDAVTDLLKTAAIDPAVTSIKISLYRVAKNSRIVDALVNAKNNYKEVTVVVELQARFDEEANINWANQLTEAGVHVIFGVPGLKVHSKLILITRLENNELKYYTHVGTGNFNEKTAELYTDFSLLTYDQEIGQDTENVFDFLAFNYRRPDFKHLLVSPHSNRSHLQQLIENEIDFATQGKAASITIKCNNLVDTKIVELLYIASNSGVRIRIICRGMCSIIPGIPNLSENIEAISIVDRFLEHARVFIFHNEGNPKYFISSADLMTRNLDFRVEVTAPIKQPALQQRIQNIIDIQWCDNQKARVLDESQSNTIHQSPFKTKIRSQELIHQYLASNKVPTHIRKIQKIWEKELRSEANKRAKQLRFDVIE